MINRNNYEEYLLLYIDGELSSAGRLAVENFIAAHPDIASELEALQQAILSPADEIRFEGKELLYREASGINLTNYENWFLLYVDNELNATQKEAVETFVLQQPQLQDEFTILKQTVLPNEWVVFQGKEILYRKEENRRPLVIGMRWASLAAAVLIALIAFVWIYRGNNASTETFAGKTSTPAVNQKSTDNKNERSLATEETAKESLAAETPVTAPQQALRLGNEKRNVTPVQVVQTPGTNQQMAKISPVIPAGDQDNNIPNTALATTGNTATPGISNNPNKAEPNFTGTPETASTNYTVQPASYTEELESDDNKHKNLYVGALEINSSKVRGFFRKASRFLSSKSKNKDGDDKVQVANVEVNKL